MNNQSWSANLILGLAIGLGVALAGWFVGQALYQIKATQRYVTVKGLDEREVAADLAIWPLNINVTGNDLSKLQGRLDSDRRLIRAFLVRQGFTASEISEAPPRITDYYAQGYTGSNLPPNRYKAEASLTLTTTKVQAAKKAMEASGELVRQGVVLAQDYGRAVEFLYTGLNQIKPPMIAAATKNARAAAEQFARDSGAKVGGIRTASQGLFTIRNRDVNTPDKKIVRVVSTVEYFLVEN
ncbi:MAG: SIMPL domain-containing protein [Thermodesulfobacteriota bacterium]